MSRQTADQPCPGVVFWFRQDLRLHDQPALTRAVARAQALRGWLLPVHVHDSGWHTQTPWGFERTGPHRLAWRHMAVQALAQHLQAKGSRLIAAHGDPVTVLAEWVHALGQPELVCEDIAAPEEQRQVQALRERGVQVETVWQSTLMAPESLPFAPEHVPDRFTTFRQTLERAQVAPATPLPAIEGLPPLPAPALLARCGPCPPPEDLTAPGQAPDARGAFVWNRPECHGGEQAALAHLEQYAARGLPHHYKSTRNALMGLDASSKWSPWLATGALSARTAWARIQAFEREHGANEGTYWLGFELLWRDHFRWLHRKHGRRLYAARGLSQQPPPTHDAAAFERWRHASTGNGFIDAGMRELAATGYLSNRMRQNVASYLIHDLGCDWRAGAAWFEACLIDHDVHSNQGNWLYLSGRGTDPRPMRRFNTALQASTYDPQGHYRRLWSTA